MPNNKQIAEDLCAVLGNWFPNCETKAAPMALVMSALNQARANGYRAGRRAVQIRRGLVVRDFPDCNGDPNSCPENEGCGCCKQPDANQGGAA